MKFMLSVLSLLLILSLNAAESLIKIPYKQDPPIIVDGNLNDWNDVPCPVQLDGKNNLLWIDKKVPFPTAENFSGTMKFCWKSVGLYVGVQVTDNHFIQRGVGMDLFYGDHVELFLDVAPREKDAGAKFGKKQFQLGISPGNFSNLKPEIFSAYPANLNLDGIRAASAKTENGWNLEIYLPWKIFAEKEILINQVIGLTAWISDTDVDTGATPRPAYVLTTGDVKAKFRDRSSITPAVFADTAGKYSAAIPQAKPIQLAEKISIQPTGKQDFTITIKDIPAFLNPVLRLQANLKSKTTFGGYARALNIFVNGKELDHHNLLTPANEFRNSQGGKGFIYQKGQGYLSPYTTDGKAGNIPRNTLRFFESHYNMHDFALDLSGLLKPGKNTISLRNTLHPRDPYRLDVTGLHVSFEATEKKALRRPAPTGKLPFIAPVTTIPMTCEYKSLQNRIELKQKSGIYSVISRFSTPDGKWATGSNPYFKFDRKIEKKAELLVVTDTFTNRTKENLPLIQEHKVTLPGTNSTLRLCGLEYSKGKNLRRSYGNYSVFAGLKSGGGVGLYPLNPEFQIHSGGMIPEPHTVALCDDATVIPPGKSAVRQFVLVPLDKGTYYDFVNVTRRYLGVNRQLQGPAGDWPPFDYLAAYYSRLDIYNIYFAIVDLPKIGKAFLTSPMRKLAKKYIAEIRKRRPSAKILRYFHSQIESDPNLDWKEGKVLLKNGSQAIYGGGSSRLYLNIEGTPYTKMMEEALDEILEKWDVDGIYWDEFNASGVKYHYGDPWDQCSGDIDPFTHKLIQLKSSVYLIQKPWKTRMADKILAKGKLLYTNGGDSRMGNFANKVSFTFTETEVESNNTRVHFTTPLSYANSFQLSKNKFEYYYKFLKALEYGCLSNYASLSMPNYGKVYRTISDHLYPSTPLELKPGYMLAKERIVTAKSGIFGWNDNAQHTVYVYDHEGREVKNHSMKTISVNGKTWSEIRLPQDWSAVIVKK